MAGNRGRRATGTIAPAVVLVENDMLKLDGNPAHADYAAFEKACGTFTRTSCASVLVDLTRCTYLNSMFVGLLVDTVVQMKGAGKEVKVCVSPEVGRFFNMAHLFHLFDYEVIAPNGGSD